MHRTTTTESNELNLLQIACPSLNLQGCAGLIYGSPSASDAGGVLLRLLTEIIKDLSQVVINACFFV